MQKPKPSGMDLDSRLLTQPWIWLYYAALVALLAGVYFHSVLDLPLQEHDADTFSDNEAIDRDWTVFFSLDKQQVSARPVAELVKWLAYWIGGNNPAWFHAWGIALHGLAAWLLARWSWRSGAPLAVALLGGLLFFVQVGHYQAVHHISALDYPLALALGLAALLCWHNYLGRGHRGWLAGVYGLLTLAVLSHKALIVLWALALLVGWRSGGKQWRQLLPAGLWLGLLAALLLHLTPENTHVRGSLAAYEEESVWALISGMGRLLLWLLSRLLTTSYGLFVDVYEQYAWEPWVGGLVLAGLLVLGWKRPGPLALWAAWTLLLLVPFVALTDQLVQSSAQISSRYLYMASAGPAVLLVWLLYWGTGRLRAGGLYLFIGLTAALLVSSYWSLQKTEALTLYAAGRRFIGRGELEPGVQALQRAIEQAPEVLPVDAFVRYGTMGLAQGQDTRAGLQRGLRYFPDELDLRIHLAVLEHEFGQGSSVKELVQELRQSGKEAEFLVLAARVYHNLGTGHMKRETCPWPFGPITERWSCIQTGP